MKIWYCLVFRTSCFVFHSLYLFLALAPWREKFPPHLQGSSFRAVLQDTVDWDHVAFSQYPRTTSINGQNVKVIGYSMRTSDYRLTKWIKVETRETLDMEFYDHSHPLPEMTNLAEMDHYKDIIPILNQKLEEEYEKEHGKSLTE